MRVPLAPEDSVPAVAETNLHAGCETAVINAPAGISSAFLSVVTSGVCEEAARVAEDVPEGALFASRNGGAKQWQEDPTYY